MEHCQVSQGHHLPATPPSNVQTLALAEDGKKKDGMKKQEFQTFAASTP
jgi:hypothetical protein